MAFRLLVHAAGRVAEDAAKDHRMWKRGDLVSVRPADGEWGAKERLPDFVRLHVVDGDLELFRGRLSQWRTDVRFDVLAAGDDGVYTVRAVTPETEIGADRRHRIQAGRCSPVLDRFGARCRQVADNHVEVLVDVAAAVKTELVFGADAPRVRWDRESYAGGTYQGRANYGALSWSEAQAEAAVAGMAIVDHTAPFLTVRVHGDAVVREVLRRARARLNKLYRRSKFRLKDALIEQAEAAGGELEVRVAQLVGALRDLREVADVD